MASITWKVETAAGMVEKSTPALPEESIERFIDWVWYQYPQIDMTDPNNPVSKPRTQATEVDAVNDWMAAEWVKTKNLVVGWEQREAAQAASDAIAELDELEV